MAGYDNHTVQSNGVQSSEDEDYPVPPPMPKKLPKLVELLISKTPEIYQPAVACAIFLRWLPISGEPDSDISTTWSRKLPWRVCSTDSPKILYVLRGIFYTKKVREHSFAHGLFKLSDSYKCLMP